MLYRLIKGLARFGINLFCRKIVINKPENLHINGPLLLACNHPNSFLDSIILNTLFKNPVWSLARGDVFKKPLYKKLLTLLNILPVYRTSEGVENLSENYKTFDASIELFRKNGIITIYSEGKCINEWHLRPLKKGTARLAIKAWEENIPLNVLPVGINYSSFRLFGKNVIINFGNPIIKEDITISESDGIRNAAFNQLLKNELEKLVIEIPNEAIQKRKELFYIHQPVYKKILLFIPAIAGWVLHAPIFLPVKNYAWKRTKGTDHYDSVIIAITLVFYPFYIVFLSVFFAVLAKSLLVFLIILLLPLLAWSYIQLKTQIEKN